LYHKNIFTGAIPYLKEASEKIPDNPIVRYHLGMAYYKSDKKEMAKKELTAALKMDPKFAGADKAKAALVALR
jgi:tetratricopeptide (TPR) repeat protein